jgi:hypothetical protein
MTCQLLFSAAGRFCICLLAPLFTLALSAAANAAGQFGSPFVLSGIEQQCAVPRVAINADGNAIFTWAARGLASDDFPNFRARARTRSKTGIFGHILTLSGRSFGPGVDPRPAIDAAGNALVAWTLFDKSETSLLPGHAQFRRLSSAGVLGPITEMSSVLPADSARVAMSPNGKAVLFWRRRNSDDTLSTMETRTRSAAGVLGPVKSVSLFQSQGEFSAEVAMNARGDAVFAWRRQVGGVNPHSVVQLRRRAAGGGFGLLHQNLGTEAAGANPVAIDGQGNAIVTWLDNISNSVRMEMRTLSAADVLGPQQFVSHGIGNAAAPQVAMNEAGDAALAYLEFDGSIFEAKASIRPAGGGIAGPFTVSPPGAFAFSPGAVIDAHSRSMFVWNAGPTGATKAQARTRSATGALGGVRTLDNAAAPALFTSIAMNPRGDAAAVWCEAEQRGDGNVFTIHGAVTPSP